MKKKKKQILDKRRIEIINLSKDLIIKHGWNDLLFKKIHENKIVNIKELDVLFLNGYREMIRFFFDNLNKKLEDKNKNQNFLREPVHKRIRKILISKLEIINKDKPFFKRTFNYLLIPGNYRLLTKLLYKSVDTMWYISKDSSTDFNFYTKRMILVGIYIPVVIHLLNKDNMLETERKLDNLLFKVSKIPKIKNKFKLLRINIPSFFNLIRNYKI